MGKQGNGTNGFFWNQSIDVSDVGAGSESDEMCSVGPASHVRWAKLTGSLFFCDLLISLAEFIFMRKGQ